MHIYLLHILTFHVAWASLDVPAAASMLLWCLLCCFCFLNKALQGKWIANSPIKQEQCREWERILPETKMSWKDLEVKDQRLHPLDADPSSEHDACGETELQAAEVPALPADWAGDCAELLSWDCFLLSSVISFDLLAQFHRILRSEFRTTTKSKHQRPFDS